MKNIGTGNIHNDHLYLNSCLDYDDLLKVDEQYQLEHNTEFGLLIEQANAKTNWRYRIARWMLRVADEFHLKRDTALIALNYFDRMMSRQVARRPIDRDCVQVAAITCLFVASKLFQKHPLKMSALMLYTKNSFQKEDILAMEQELLLTNKSHFYPVTASTFVCILLNDGLSSEHPETIAKVIESCQFMIELAACDYFFTSHRASTISVAAIVVTLETQLQLLTSTIKVPIISPEAVSSCLSRIETKINYTEDGAVKECVQKLRAIYIQNEQRIRDMEENKAADDEVARYTKENEAGKDCRVATPSPTDPVCYHSDSSPPKLVEEDQISRKRRRNSREII